MRYLRAAVAVAQLVVVTALAAATDKTQTAASAPKKPEPKAAALARVDVEFPDANTAKVTLHVVPSSPLAATEFAEHRVTLANVAVPMSAPAALTPRAGEVLLTFPIKLADVPEDVLSLPLEQLAVRWFGLGADGAPALIVSGIVNVQDRAQVVVRDEDLRRHFARLGPVTATPGLGKVGVRALLNIYNPFRFELVATRMAYRLTVGENELVAAERAGFRLRAGQGSDVLIEQEVALTDVASAAIGLLQQQPVRFAGKLVVRTPKGEREFPMFLKAGS